MISFVQEKQQLRVDPLLFSSIILSAAYLVGVICIGFDVYPALVDATSFNLLLTFILLVGMHQGDKKKILWFAGLAYALGFTAEIIGVQSGLIFGEYTYGRVLGPKLLGTPFLIGVNWTVLVLSAGVLLDKYLGGKSKTTKSIIGAAGLTSLDVFIEPVATTLDMWSWTDDIIPLQNYAGWFIVSFIMFRIYFGMNIKGDNKLAGLCLLLIFLFFLILNITLDHSNPLLTQNVLIQE